MAVTSSTPDASVSKHLMKILKSTLACIVAGGLLAEARAAIIGTNVPAQPLTMARIATLPEASQADWKNYLSHSQRQMQADKDFFYSEMKAAGANETNAPYAGNFNKIPLNKSDAWYASREARHIADVIVSFQTPAGGWSKHIDMTGTQRVPGMRFTSDNNSHYISANDLDLPSDAHWSYVGTFDNDATTTQLRFLAKVIAALPSEASIKYRASFSSGLHYLFAAQYPNGGWPQVWPLQGGYHDAITFNDGAMVHVLNLLMEIASGTNEFGFVPENLRMRASASVKHGIECVLACQITERGHRTVWCQQHDLLTLKPTSARNYEMPCESAAESADLMVFLMSLPKPDSQVVASVSAAAAWFKQTAIYGYAFKFTSLQGRQLVASSGGGPIWARYYEIGTDRPIFGDRDKTIHDQVRDISAERRKGYSWYGDAPKRALRRYEGWKEISKQTTL